MLAAVDTKFLYKKIEHMTRVSALYNLKPYTYEVVLQLIESQFQINRKRMLYGQDVRSMGSTVKKQTTMRSRCKTWL